MKLQTRYLVLRQTPFHRALKDILDDGARTYLLSDWLTELVREAEVPISPLTGRTASVRSAAGAAYIRMEEFSRI